MKSILIIEDTTTMKLMLKNALKVLDCVIVATSNISQTEERLKQFKPDLVITDINLPDGNALDFIKEKKSVYFNNCEFIIITGFANKETLEKATALNITNIMSKPINLDEFLLKIKKILGFKL